MNEYLTYNKIVSNPLFNLNKVFRYNSYRLLFPESTAEHTYVVSILSLILTEEFNRMEEKEIVNTKETLYRAVIHDIGESFCPDVISKVKKSSQELNDLIDNLESKLMRESGFLTQQRIEDIENAKDFNNREGLIVALSDRLSALIKIDSEYHMQNNHSLYQLFQETYKGVVLALEYIINSEVYSGCENVKLWAKKFKEELILKRDNDKLEIPDYSDSISRDLWSKTL